MCVCIHIYKWSYKHVMSAIYCCVGGCSKSSPEKEEKVGLKGRLSERKLVLLFKKRRKKKISY